MELERLVNGAISYCKWYNIKQMPLAGLMRGEAETRD
jgi:hypothetical protein